MAFNSWREEFWAKRGRPKELYPDVSSKDAPVPPDLPVPNCDHGSPADVSQSRHPETAARCFYECSSCNPYERCFFFQWIDGPDKFEPRYLLFNDWWRGRHRREHFKRWVPPPPNPPPMTKEEQEFHTFRRLENPPLCHCGDQAVINPRNDQEFECPNVLPEYQLLRKCDFKEWLWGRKSLWPEEKKEEEIHVKENVIHIEEDVLCKCGVKAKYGLVPSELGIGYWCGHMVDYDESTRKCTWESFSGARKHNDTIKAKQVIGRKIGCGNQLVREYIKMRKQEMREEASKRRLTSPQSVQWEKRTAEANARYAEQKAREAEDKQLQELKDLEAQLRFKIGDVKWEVDIARSLHIQQKVEEAQKKAADGEDTSRLDELIALAEADLAEKKKKEKGPGASHAHEVPVADDGDDTSRLDDLIALAQADLDEMKKKGPQASPVHEVPLVEVDEHLEWCSQNIDLIDQVEGEYFKKKAKKGTSVGTSQMNWVSLEDSSSDDELLIDYVSDVEGRD